MTPDSRARWTELLPGPTGAPEEATAAFLRALSDDEFLPSAERVAAVNALAGASVPVGQDPEVERRLCAELDAFAAGYWALAPVDRLVAWADLSRRGADAARLRELEPGLDVAAPALDDPPAEALAGLIRTLFALPARARAVRRNAWLLDQAARVEKWQVALAVVQRAAPALVALEPRLRAALVPGFPLAVLVEGALAAPVSIPATGTIEAAVSGNRSRPQATQPRSTGSGWLGFTIGGVPIFALIVIGKILILVGNPSKTPNPTPPKPPAWRQPVPAESSPSAPNTAALQELRAKAERLLADRPSRDSNTTARAFTPAEVAEFERYERETEAGESPHTPPGYDSWHSAGRPPGVTTTKVPAESRPSYSFDRELIEMCQSYEEGMTRVKPRLYGYWVAAGKPTVPGVHSLIHPIP